MKEQIEKTINELKLVLVVLQEESEKLTFRYNKPNISKDEFDNVSNLINSNRDTKNKVSVSIHGLKQFLHNQKIYR